MYIRKRLRGLRRAFGGATTGVATTGTDVATTICGGVATVGITIVTTVATTIATTIVTTVATTVATTIATTFPVARAATFPVARAATSRAQHASEPTPTGTAFAVGAARATPTLCRP